MALIHHWPLTTASITTTVNDVVGTAHLSLMDGATLRYATGTVKGNEDTNYLPVCIHGLAGYTAPAVRLSDNALSGTIENSGTSCSLSMLVRMNQPVAGTLMRWEGGYSYLYCAATGELQLEGPSAHVIATLSELGGPGVWARLTLIRSGTTTLVYINNTNVRTTARAINIPAGTIDLLSYQSTRVSPGGYDLADIRIYSHQLSEAEIAALVTADGENPVAWSWYNESGSDVGEGCLMTENGLSAGGYTGYTYYDIADVTGIGTRTKFWTNGESCRYGKAYYVGSKTTLNCYFKFLIPAENVMNDDHSSPGPSFSLIQFQSSSLITDIATNYVVLIQAIWEDPADEGGARLRRYQTVWYDAANTPHAVAMADADIATDQEISVEAQIVYNDDASIIKVWIDDVLVTDIADADFTGKAAIASVMAFPFNGVHQSIKEGTDSYAVYMGTQYVGDAAYVPPSTGVGAGHMTRTVRNFLINNLMEEIYG